MRKKFIKYVAVLVACIIAFSIFLVPVSALTVDGQYYNGIKVTGLTVSLIKGDGTLIEVEPTVVYNNPQMKALVGRIIPKRAKGDAENGRT